MKKKKRDMRLASKNALSYDGMSTWHPADYEMPRVVVEYMKTFEERVRKMVDRVKVDEYNDGFLDEEIDKMMNLGKQDLLRQQIGHKRLLEDIRRGQEGRLDELKRKVKSLERTITMLKKEVEGNG